jgi:uncharacterized protein YndB with AHSA1/START domain
MTPRSETPSDLTLQIRRIYEAPRQAVFDAWIRPEMVPRWFCPDPGGTVVVPVMEPRPGGRYRIEMRLPDGQAYDVSGVYREVRAPERLVFTWVWDHDPPETPAMLVTVELHERGAATELVLTHERFVTTEVRDKHSHGWNGSLARLITELQKGAPR